MFDGADVGDCNSDIFQCDFVSANFFRVLFYFKPNFL